MWTILGPKPAEQADPLFFPPPLINGESSTQMNKLANDEVQQREKTLWWLTRIKDQNKYHIILHLNLQNREHENDVENKREGKDSDQFECVEIEIKHIFELMTDIKHLLDFAVELRQ